MRRVLRPVGASAPWRHERFTRRVLLPVLQALIDEARGFLDAAATEAQSARPSGREANARDRERRKARSHALADAEQASAQVQEYPVFERSHVLPRECGRGHLTQASHYFEPSWWLKYPTTLRDVPIENSRRLRLTKKGWRTR